jgi:hypothetical protein
MGEGGTHKVAALPKDFYGAQSASMKTEPPKIVHPDDSGSTIAIVAIEAVPTADMG